MSLSNQLIDGNISLNFVTHNLILNNMKEQKQLEVNGKTYPLNLKVLKDEGKIDDYEIKPVYYLELKHGLMGFFPAIVDKPRRIILTKDKNLLEKIWRMLSPRSSKMDDNLFYVHKSEPVAYLAKDPYGDDEATPYHLMTKEEYDLLVKENENPFQWAPGLVGNDMSPQEFLETIIQAASEKI